MTVYKINDFKIQDENLIDLLAKTAFYNKADKIFTQDKFRNFLVI